MPLHLHIGIFVKWGPDVSSFPHNRAHNKWLWGFLVFWMMAKWQGEIVVKAALRIVFTVWSLCRNTSFLLSISILCPQSTSDKTDWVGEMSPPLRHEQCVLATCICMWLHTERVCMCTWKCLCVIQRWEVKYIYSITVHTVCTVVMFSSYFTTLRWHL